MNIFQKIYDLILLIAAVPISLIVYLLRPLVVVRFGYLISDRIGHFAGNIETYLCERDAGMYNKNTFDIFYHSKSICNYQLKKMWGRTLHVSPFSRLTKQIVRINNRLPDGEKHVVPLMIYADRDVNNYFKRTPAHLFFTSEEERFGKMALMDLGIPENAPFICFHARDTSYLDTLFPSEDWNYQYYRNSSIHNYIAMAEELVKRGCFAIRMGSIVKDHLTNGNPKIIDYASKHRTDFLDIYLSAKCKFFVGGNSGILMVSSVFRRPVVYVNYIPIERVTDRNTIHLFIPKKLFLKKENRFLSFKENIKLGLGRGSGKIRGHNYKQFGLEVLENTSEEIADVAVEMDERINGTWRETEEDKELQSRFWSLFDPSELKNKGDVKIGAKFLRQNQELLE